ncbi:3-isopropylmalate dehydratase [Selenomonas sp. AB3002]|uniref:LeuD/DmdB family oxidoreductase small subunit n=1 Tax=Selenomonas sp. AB3002 TaxID=1392502 RepID=UPI0004983A28
MEKMIKGRVYVFGNNVDTDQIYPGKYVEYTEMEDICRFAMSGSEKPELAQSFQPGEIIVGGTNFGCGSSREHATMTLKGIGVGAIIAESFARIFFRNAINLGIPAITCPGISQFFQDGEEASIDLASGMIKNVSNGQSLQAEPMGEYMEKILENGGIKAMIRAQIAKEK